MSPIFFHYLSEQQQGHQQLGPYAETIDLSLSALIS